MPLLPEPLQRLTRRLSGARHCPKTARMGLLYFKSARSGVYIMGGTLKDCALPLAPARCGFNITLADHLNAIFAGMHIGMAALSGGGRPHGLLAIERQVHFKEVHVLQVHSPIEGIGPDDQRIRELEERVKAADSGDHHCEQSEHGRGSTAYISKSSWQCTGAYYSAGTRYR